MSTLLEWALTNKVTVWPFVAINRTGGGVTYGDPYTIPATWRYKAEKRTNEAGKEYVAKGTVWHEDERPREMDKMVLGGSDLPAPPAGAILIQGYGFDDMTPFGDDETPDRTIYF